MSATRLTMSDVAKSFGPTAALSDVDLELHGGEVHALIGENGAGKSTLMKVLGGVIRPDRGQMRLGGRSYMPANPRDARRRGVVMVHQELNLAPHLTVAENIVLGQERSFLGVLRPGADLRRVEAALAELSHPEIRPETPVADLNPAARQLVEIARALVGDVRVLVLDEPTQALDRADAERLFALIRKLKDRGVAVAFISHFLEEVEEIADRYTVLRDGRSVGGGTRSEFRRERVIEQMVGRALTEQFPRVPHEIGQPALEVYDLAGRSLPRGVTLTVRRGEILGIAGMLGSGRTELLRSVFGLDPVRLGRVSVLTNRRGGASPRGRIRQGVGLLSEDRKSEGLALEQSLADNLTYSHLRPYKLLGWLNLGKRRAAVADWLGKLSVKARDPDQPVRDLSGGNQQKVAIGRLLHQDADVYLLDEPTRGVDVVSKAEIYKLIGDLAARGKAVLLVSSYLPELFGVCDTLAVMARGKLTPARPVQEWTPEQALAAATA